MRSMFSLQCVFENEYKAEMHFKESLTKLHHCQLPELHIHNLTMIIDETYFNYKLLISKRSNFKNSEQVGNFRIKILLSFFLIGSCLTS